MRAGSREEEEENERIFVFDTLAHVKYHHTHKQCWLIPTRFSLNWIDEYGCKMTQKAVFAFMPSNFYVEVCLFDYNEDIASHNIHDYDSIRFDSFLFHFPHSIWYICWRVDCESVQNTHIRTLFSHSRWHISIKFITNAIFIAISHAMMFWCNAQHTLKRAPALKISKWTKFRRGRKKN